MRKLDPCEMIQELEEEKGNGRSVKQLVRLPDIFICCEGKR